METKKNIYAAIAAFQQAVPVIYKDSQAYGYKYADLPAILEVINPLLKEHGLGFTQIINGITLQTIVFHVESGEKIESNIDIPQGVDLKGMNPFQVLGSAITYLRRYALSSMLGLVTDKDTDAQGEQVNSKPAPKSTPKPEPASESAPAEKEFMNQSHEKYKDALQAVKEGKANVLQIEKRYTLSPEAKKELTNTQLNK